MNSNLCISCELDLIKNPSVVFSWLKDWYCTGLTGPICCICEENALRSNFNGQLRNPQALRELIDRYEAIKLMDEL